MSGSTHLQRYDTQLGIQWDRFFWALPHPALIEKSLGYYLVGSGLVWGFFFLKKNR